MKLNYAVDLWSVSISHWMCGCSIQMRYFEFTLKHHYQFILFQNTKTKTKTRQTLISTKKIPKMICCYFCLSKNKKPTIHSISFLFSTHTNRVAQFNSIPLSIYIRTRMRIPIECSRVGMSFSISDIVEQINVIWSFQIQKKKIPLEIHSTSIGRSATATAAAAILTVCEMYPRICHRRWIILKMI